MSNLRNFLNSLSTKKQVKKPMSQASVIALQALEPRYLLDAAAATTLGEAASISVAEAQTDDAIAHLNQEATPSAEISADSDNISGILSPPGLTSEENSNDVGPSVVFIDGATSNIQEQIRQISLTSDVFILEPTQDGVVQIADVLEQYDSNSIIAVHVLANGGAGELNLGAAILNSASISSDHTGQLDRISERLATNSEIFLYGAAFTDDIAGEEVAQQLAARTGAQVTAIDNAGDSEVTPVNRLASADSVIEIRARALQSADPSSASEPNAVNDGPIEIHAGETLIVDVLGNDSSADGTSLEITGIIDPVNGMSIIPISVGATVNLASGAQVSLRADGALNVTAPLNPTEQFFTFDYIATDGEGNTAQATVTLDWPIDTDGDGVNDEDDVDDDNDGILDVDEGLVTDDGGAADIGDVALNALGIGAGRYQEDGALGVAILQADGSVSFFQDGVETTDLFDLAGSGTEIASVFTLEQHIFGVATDGTILQFTVDSTGGPQVVDFGGATIAGITGDHNNALIVLDDGTLRVGSSSGFGVPLSFSTPTAGEDNSDFVSVAGGGFRGSLFAMRSDGTVFGVGVNDLNTIVAIPELNDFVVLSDAAVDSGGTAFALLPDGSVLSWDSTDEVPIDNFTRIDPPAGESFVDVWALTELGFTGSVTSGLFLTDQGNVYELPQGGTLTQVPGLSGIDEIAGGGRAADHFVAIDYDTNTAFLGGASTTINLPADHTIRGVTVFSEAFVFALENDNTGDIELWGGNNPNAFGVGGHFSVDVPDLELLTATPNLGSDAGTSAGASSGTTGMVTGRDSDGDGFFDHLDLDSDNDGITDNIEAQSTDGFIAPSGVAGTPGFVDVNQDGLDDNFDARSVANGGAGLAAGSAAATSAEALVSPVDTDSDGTADFLDTDSDNDMVDDVAENGLGQTAIANGTASNAMNDADGDGLFDQFENEIDGAVGDGFVVNEGITDPLSAPNGFLPDADNDAASGIPLTADLDFRDAQDDTPLNADPVANADNITIRPGVATIIDPLADNGNGADTDADGDTLTISQIIDPADPGNPITPVFDGATPITLASGVVITALADGTLSVVAPRGITSAATFAYTISDGNGGTDTGTVTLNADTDGDGVADVNDIDDDNDGILDVDEGLVTDDGGAADIGDVALNALGIGAGRYQEDGALGVAILQADGSVSFFQDGVETTDLFDLAGSGTEIASVFTLEQHIFGVATDGTILQFTVDSTGGPQVVDFGGATIAGITGDHNNALIVLDDGTLRVGSSSGFGVPLSFSTPTAGEDNSDFVSVAGGGFRGSLFAMRSDGTVFGVGVNDLNTIVAIPELNDFVVLSDAAVDSGGTAFALLPDGSVLSWDSTDEVPIDNFTRIDPPAGESFVDVWALTELGFTGSVTSGLFLTDQGNVYELPQGGTLTQVPGLSGIDEIAGGGRAADHFVAIDYDTNTAFLGGASTTINLPADHTIRGVTVFSEAFVFALENDNTGDIELWGGNNPNAFGVGGHFSVDVPDLELLTATPNLGSDAGTSAGASSGTTGMVTGRDSDGDGFFDHLDLDSDNDGITDNIEAQSTDGFIAPSGVAGTPGFVDVNQDGLDDNFDARSVANGGAGLAAGSAAATSAEALVSPVDTDSDGTADFLDTDSDNDMVDDVAENGLGQTAIANGTASNAMNDADGDGLFDQFENEIDGAVGDGFVVNEGITDPLSAPNGFLPDADNDAASGIPLTADLDFRDAQDDTPLNADPVANADNITIRPGVATIIDPLADNGNGADTDADGDTLTISQIIDPADPGNPITPVFDGATPITLASGVVITPLADGTLSVIAPRGITSAATFAYTISDGNGGTDTGTVTLNADTDGDGVNDEDDVDDDNDGILDVDEQAPSTVGIQNLNNGDISFANSATSQDVLAAHANNTLLGFGNFTDLSRPLAFSIDVDNNQIIRHETANDNTRIIPGSSVETQRVIDAFVAGDFVGVLRGSVFDLGAFIDGDQIIRAAFDGNSSPALISFDANNVENTIAAQRNGTLLGTSFDGVNNFGYFVSGNEILFENWDTGEIGSLGSTNTAEIIAAHNAGTLLGIGGFGSNIFGYFASTSDLDTDSDGIVDRVDLDSDNDGITDNIEAQSTDGFIAPSGVAGTPGFTDVNQDGLDDNFDARSVANGGTGLAAGSAAATSAEALVSPVDTDSDGTADFIDTDSDDDGVDDVAENGLGQAAIANGTASNAMNDADGDGLFDQFENEIDGAIDDNFVVNEGITDPLSAPNGFLPDADNDAASGIPLTADLDFRDAQDDTPLNADPVANADNITIRPGVATIIDPLADNGNGADTDADGDTLTISQIIDPADPGNPITPVFDGATPITLASGVVITPLVDGTLSVVVPRGIASSVAFDYTVSDGNGGTDSATITLNADADGDGIVDNVDVDDDNDGILDAVEDLNFGQVQFEFFNSAPPGNSVFNIPETGADATGLFSSFNVRAIADQETPGDRNTFSVRFTGQLNITEGNTYTFSTNSDDGSALFINGELVVSNDGVRGPTTRSGTIELEPGIHEIEVIYFELGGGETLSVFLSSPTMPNQLLPFSLLAPPVDLDNDGIINSLDLDSDNDGITDNIEAQSTAGFIAPSGVAGTPGFTDVNQDGLDDNFDARSVANGGAGLTASSAAATSAEALVSPVDTDSDGTADFLDADSDDDGVDDVAENGLGQTAIANGTASNAMNDADGDGLFDQFENEIDGAINDGFVVNEGITDPLSAPNGFLPDADNDATSGVPLTADLDFRDAQDDTPLNADPVANADNITIRPGVATTIDPLADNGNGADTDADGDTLTITQIIDPADPGNPVTPVFDGATPITLASGVVITPLADGTLSVVAPRGIASAATFAYTISDGNGGTDTGTVTLNADTDGDGVADVNDIDDDNDGILDEAERQNLTPTNLLSSNLVEIGSVNFVSGFDAPGVNDNILFVSAQDGLNDTAGGSFLRVSNGFQDQGRPPANGVAEIDFDTANLIPNADLRFSLDVGALPFTNFADFTVELVADGIVIGALTGDQPMAREFTAHILDVSLTAAQIAGGVSLRITVPDTGTVNAIAAFDNAQIFQLEADADGDGVINSLDLDSDNDGITDNIEAQSTAGFIAPSGVAGTPGFTDVNQDGLDDNFDARSVANGGAGLTASSAAATSAEALVNPVDTDGDGAADFMDADSDDDGLSDTFEAGLTGTATGLSTSANDADGDGLFDVFDEQGGTAADDGFNVNESIANGAADLPNTDSDAEVDFRSDLDTDSDGVVDSQDVDDDNDGILDVDESTIVSSLTYAFVGDFDGTRDRGVIDALNRDFVFGDDFSFTLDFDAPVGVRIFTTIGDRSFGRTGTVTVDGDVQNIATGSNVFQTVTHSPTLSSSYSVDVVGNDLTITQLIVEDLDGNVLAAFDFGTPTSPLEPGFIRISGPGSGMVPVSISNGDSDGDGILNSLDIDSDNDGITDNIEAQSTGGFIAPSGVAGTPGFTDVNQDGLDDNFDARSVANGGAGLTASSAAATSAEALTPVDTDGDGAADFMDADSDDDGIDDIAERGDGGPTSITLTTDTDGDGLLDIFEGRGADDGFVVSDENVNITGSTLDSFNLAGVPGLDADGGNADPLIGGAAGSRDLLFRDVNDAPVATNNTFTANEDDAAAVVGNAITAPTADSDFDGDTLTVAAQSNVAGSNGGTFSIAANGNVTFDPGSDFEDLAAGESRNTTFTYTVSDGNGGNDTATITVSVSGRNNAPVAADDSVTVDEDMLASGDLTPGVSGQDSDAEGDTLTVTQFVVDGNTITVDPVNGGMISLTEGVLTINADGAFTFDPAQDFSGSVPQITYTVSDGNGGTDTASLDITFDAINDAPSLSGTAISTQNGADGESGVSVDAAAAFTDVDSDDLTFSATGLPPGLSINTTTGEITGTINQSASVNGPYTVTVTAEDPSGEAVSTNFIWTVTNPAPQASDDGVVAVTEDMATTISPLGNDVDPDGDALTITAINGTAISVGSPVTLASGASVALNADGTLTYTPADNQNGADSFSYTVTDADGAADTATVSVNVGAVNDAPTAIGSLTLQSFDDGETIPTIATAGLFNDLDGDTLSFSATGLPPGLSIDPATGEITGTVSSSASASGPFNVVITATDPNGESATVSAVWAVTNPAPQASDDGVVAVTEDMATTISPLGNDVDPDGDALTITAINGTAISVGSPVTLASGASVALNADGTLTYTPADNQNGADSFSYTVTDADGAADTATVSVNVGAVNDAPTAIGNLALQSFDDGETIPTIATAGLFNDLDGDTLSFSATGLPPGLSIDPATGEITGTVSSSASASGPFNVVITATDPNGESATVSAVWTVTNPAPQASDDGVVAVTEDMATTIAPLGNDVDPDGDALTITAINGTEISVGSPVTLASGASVALNADGTLTYTPADNQNGADSFSYTVTDADGAADTATVSVNVGAVNDAPTAIGSLTLQSFDDDETIPTIATAGLFNDLDGDTLSFSATGLPPGLSIDPATGEITGTVSSSASASGPFNVVITATDPNGESATVSAVWAVTNPAPQASDDGVVAVTEDMATTISPLGNDVDPDGDALTITAINGTAISVGSPVTLASGASVALNADGTLTYTPADNQNGADSFSYTVTDADGAADTATVSVNVGAVNDAPTAIGNLTLQSFDDGETIPTIATAGLFNDLDGDTLSFSATGLPPGLSINPATGEITGTVSSSASASGPFNVVITATDPNGESATVSAVWTVTNPAPQADTISNEAIIDGGTVAIDTASAFSDPDGDTLTFSATGLPSYLEIDPITGEITGTAPIDASSNGPISVTVIADDGEGGTASETFLITPSNPTPVVTPTADQTSDDGETVSLNVANAFSDPDGDPLTFTATGLPPGLSIDPVTGIISGVLSNSASVDGPYTVIVTATDAEGAQAVDTFIWNVDNLVPSIVNQIPNQSANDGEAFDLDVTPFFTDGDGDATTFSANGLPPGLSIDPATGVISGMLPNDASLGQPYIVSVTVDDGEGGSVTDTFAFTINNLNPGIVEQIQNQNSNDGEMIAPLDIFGNFEDPDGDPLTFTATGLPPGLVLDSNTGVITGTIDPSASVDGPYVVTITASDGSNEIVDAFTWNVTNPAPELAAVVPDQLNTDGETISLQIASFFNDPDGDVLTFSAEGLPQGLSIDPDTGEITGSLPNDASVDGPYSITLTVTDADGASTVTAFTWNIDNIPPQTIGEPQNLRFSDGEAVIITTSEFFEDFDADPLTFSATGLPPGLSINPNTGVISGTIASSASQNGLFTPIVTVTDNSGDSAFITFAVTAQNTTPVANDDVVITPEDTPVTVDLLANDTDDDGDALTITQINGFPVSPEETVVLPSGTSVTLNSDGTVTFTPVPNGNGVEEISYTISDAEGGEFSATVTFDVTPMQDAPFVSQTPFENQTNDEADDINIDVSGFFTDPDSDPLTFAAEGLPSGLSIDPATGIISGVIEVGSAINGPFDVTITVTDPAGNDVSFTFIWNVNASGADIQTLVELGGNNTQQVLEDVETPDQVSSLSSIKAEGVVLDTANDINNLDGLPSINADNVILAAVNGESSLNGIGNDTLSDNSIRDLVARFNERFDVGVPLSEVELAEGFSYRAIVADAEGDDPESESGKLVIDTFVRDRVLYVEVFDTIDSVKSSIFQEYAVTLGNGQPLPMWASFSSDGLLLIDRPADLETVTLKITGMRESGDHATRVVEIDMSTGEIKKIEKPQYAYGLSFSNALSELSVRDAEYESNVSKIFEQR